jgi:hypothetical protein
MPMRAATRGKQGQSYFNLQTFSSYRSLAIIPSCDGDNFQIAFLLS